MSVRLGGTVLVITPGIFNLGPGELILIFGILVLIFGASRLPQLGEAMGKSIKSLKRGLNTDDDIDVSPAPKQVEESSSAESAKAASAKSVSEVAEGEIVEK